jgi:hypothetical protein
LGGSIAVRIVDALEAEKNDRIVGCIVIDVV